MLSQESLFNLVIVKPLTWGLRRFVDKAKTEEILGGILPLIRSYIPQLGGLK